jgi:A/G-specific adenine glycosylase
MPPTSGAQPPAPKRKSRQLSTVVRRLERWFSAAQRALPWRLTYDPYQIWISEVMLQQTRMEVVVDRYYPRFVERFPDAGALARASETEVLAAWSGLGYYRRARMLREGALYVMRAHEGHLPRDLEALRAVPGIGRYTAGAIASIAFDDRAAIVDGNVARVIARLEGIEDLYGSAAFIRESWAAAGRLVDLAKSPRNLNQGLMELGALVCTPRAPRCPSCPIRSHCRSHASGDPERLPLRRATTATRALRINLYVVRSRDGSVLMEEATGPLMTGMAHLPQTAGLFESRGASFFPGAALGWFRHTITNRRIQFHVHEADLRNIADGPGDFFWIDPRQLESVPHPSYVRKALEIAGLAWARDPFTSFPRPCKITP